ncbi:hypothetical protein BGZ47_011559 [Haplosporangium gracile]|nr:hypothetical protein BGZ47_011559 [Haplosporangium gracile]
MVAELGDRIQINDIKKYVDARKVVTWTQDLGQEKAVGFVFIPFKCLKDATPGFIAVEFGKIKDFQKLDFKYGQNNKKIFLFLVLLDSSYKPFQHRFTSVAEGSEAMTTLGSLVKRWEGLANSVAYAGGTLKVL